MNMSQRARSLGIRFEAKLSNDPAPDDYPQGFTRWNCTLRYHRRTMTVAFHMGPALCREPTVADVLSCLASDCSTYENTRNFEDWANDFGLDPNSRKAEATYREIGKQRDELATLLGDAYQTIMFETVPE